MGDLILDMYRWFPVTGASYTTTNYSLTNSPQIGVDGITTDQSKLTYSFDFKDSHFAIISTDAVGNDIHAPSTWLEKDLATAKERGAKHMFVFAHRPVFTYKYTESVTPGGLDTNMTHANAVWDIIEKYHATYFCGHEHIYNVSQPRKNAYQVIVGSGGSPFEATTPTGKRTDQMYAWANVDVFESGKVKITIHGFDDKFGNIETIDTFNLTQ